MRFASKLFVIALALCGSAMAQQKVNAATGINYPPVTGAGVPTAACTSTNYGQPYTNTAVTPNPYYTCGSDGWVIRTGPPGPPGPGGGAPAGTGIYHVVGGEAVPTAAPVGLNSIDVSGILPPTNGGAIGMPSPATMLFDYEMPASDSGLSAFKDYSAIEGSGVSVGNCPFVAGAGPTYLAGGGANFTQDTGCDVPVAANAMRTFVAMIAPTPMVFGVYQNSFPTVIGTSIPATNGPYLMLGAGGLSWGYGINTLLAGGSESASLDSTAGLSCVAYVIGTGGGDFLYVNGLPVGSYQARGNTGLNPSGHWQLGLSSNSSAFYAGNMYRVAGWNGQLNAGQVAQACIVLAADAQTKGAVNPAKVPQTLTFPTLACDGDSIPYGVGGGNQYCAELTGMPTVIPFTITNNSIPGSTTLDESSQLNSFDIPQCSPAAPAYVDQEGGTNSLAAAGQAPGPWNDMVRFAHLVRQGWKDRGCTGRIGVQTIISRYEIDNGNANFLLDIQLTNPGSGYTSAPTLSFTGGTCVTTPTAAASESGGSVNNVQISTRGFQCTVAPSITFSAPPSGTTATATPIMSNSGNGTRETYNELVRTQALSSGFDFIIDAAANPGLGANFAYLGTSLFTPDLIHPTIAGEALLAQMHSAQLNYQIAAPYPMATTITATSYAMGPADGLLMLLPTGNQAITLPECQGLTGASYVLNNDQSAHTVTVVGANSEAINGLVSPITIPSNSTSSFLCSAIQSQTTAGVYWIGH